MNPPVKGNVSLDTKLVTDIGEMAQLAHDLAKLHDLHVYGGDDFFQTPGLRKVWPAADYERMIRGLIDGYGEDGPADLSMTGGVAVAKSGDVFYVFFQLGLVRP